MNFLVSNNLAITNRYWPTLQERKGAQRFSGFTEFMDTLQPGQQGVALIDLTVPGFNGTQVLLQLKRAFPELRLLLIANRLTPEMELAALSAGASGTVGPDLPEENIRRILGVVGEGGAWVSNAALPQLLNRLRRFEGGTPSASQEAPPHADGLGKLTPREREIVSLVGKGESNKLIARELRISDRTVKSHLSIIFQKLKVNDRLQLALLANRQPTE